MIEMENPERKRRSVERAELVEMPGIFSDPAVLRLVRRLEDSRQQKRQERTATPKHSNESQPLKRTPARI